MQSWVFSLVNFAPLFFVIFASTFQDMKTTSSNCFFVTMQLHFSTLQSLLESRIFFSKKSYLFQEQSQNHLHTKSGSLQKDTFLSLEKVFNSSQYKAPLNHLQRVGHCKKMRFGNLSTFLKNFLYRIRNNQNVSVCKKNISKKNSPLNGCLNCHLSQKQITYLLAIGYP